ncbi:SpoIIE family protein phosphatase [Streptomyces sp. NPDC005574]|uniref:SpoIIE family protein phosphatase n=1 Tax=Streptomyces sp. NPDC005574 TaxID=3156891 RepID=UPI0033A4DC3F
MDRLREQVATSAVLERAKGVVMALTGCSPDAAGEELLLRAKVGNRTLLEECWITLGGLMPPLHRPGPEPQPVTDAPRPAPGAAPYGALTGADTVGAESADADDPHGALTGVDTVRTDTAGVETAEVEPADVEAPHSALTGADTVRTDTAGAEPADVEAPDPAGDSAALGVLGRALVHVTTPRELAACLLEHLAPEAGADAVMIYTRLPVGGLALTGHAGLDDTTAAQWQRVPPLSGIAALDTLRTGEPHWLEDIEADRKQYLLIGDPPDRWLSRAWLPVLTGDSTDVCIGIMRAHGGTFPPRTRQLLRGVARLCAGRLRALTARQEEHPGELAGAIQTVFDSLASAAMLVTPLRAPSGEVEDYRIAAATAEAVDVAGRTGRDLVGRLVLECFPDMAGESLWRGCLRTLSTGEPYEGEPSAYEEIVAGTAHLFTYSVRVVRLADRLVITWIRHESSDRQEQRLADVQRLGNLGWANWNLVGEEVSWSSQVYTILARSPDSGPVALADLPRLAVAEDMPALSRAVRELIERGRPFDVPFRVAAGGGIRHLRAVAESVADVHGTPAEVHGFVQDLTAQRSAELALRRSEQAILTQHGVLTAERSMAARLQHALLPLPTRPVSLAGLRVEVAYLPAQSGLHVGGDWFSAMEMPQGDALFVVGDVAGHGIDAVATMAQLRFTAKGMIITGSSLTGALHRLNALLLHSHDAHGSATMMLARYDAAERRLLWAQAGHLPPLLLRGGKATYLDRPRGILLGAHASPVYEEAECHLQPGDRLILFTDGLVERPLERIDLGLERLASAALAHDTALPGSLDRVLNTVLEGERRDDVCVVDIRVPLVSE